jgi:nucleoid DNA-binding protein
MTKQEFIDRVAAKSGLSEPEAGKAVDAILDSITEALKANEEVSFTGFGKFTSSQNTTRIRELGRAADELRDGARELEANHNGFEDRIAESRETLREIAAS